MQDGEKFPYQLSDHVQKRIAERDIQLQWIITTMSKPALVKPHPDDPNCWYAYGVIPEAEGRVLKVVYNTLTQPWLIVTVHFDRRMRGKL
jgi:hypothetical protein